MSRIWSICIIGGGPAGCAAALAAGLQPDEALLLEAESQWREKPCGDAITNSGMAALQQLGVTAGDLLGLGGKPFERIDIFARNAKLLEFCGDGATGWMVRRNKFDQLLRDRATRCCTLVYGASVRGIERDAQGFALTVASAAGDVHVERCRFVVLATGARNKLSRALALSGDASNAPAITAYRKRREGPDFGLRFYFDKSLPRGYSWAFDADDDTVNIGVGSLADPPGFEIKQHAMAMAADWPGSSASTWRGGVIPLWSGKATTWHSNSGVISCGDAAGVADPVTAEGIGQALLTGAWAGQCARDYIEHGGTGRLAEYSSQVREHFTGEYRRRGVFALLAGAA